MCTLMSKTFCDVQLPNRLGKMLAPLHWHDYKKAYGKLDDFVAGHPEVILCTLCSIFFIFFVCFRNYIFDEESLFAVICN